MRIPVLVNVPMMHRTFSKKPVFVANPVTRRLMASVKRLTAAAARRGRNCATGICHADECASDEPFTYADWMLTYKYRCHRKIDNQMLCARTSTTDNYKCFYQHQLCMWTNSSLVQQEGTCDPAMCTEISSTAQYTFWGDANTMFGSCDFGDNLICYPRNNYSLWDCFKNGYRCGSGCTDPLDCGNCQTEYCIIMPKQAIAKI